MGVVAGKVHFMELIWVVAAGCIVELADFLSLVAVLDVEGAACGLHDAGRGAAGVALGNKLCDDVIEEAGVE